MFFHLCPSTSDLFGSRWEWDDLVALVALRSLARHLGFNIKEPWRCPASHLGWKMSFQ